MRILVLSKIILFHLVPCWSFFKSHFSLLSSYYYIFSSSIIFIHMYNFCLCISMNSLVNVLCIRIFRYSTVINFRVQAYKMLATPLRWALFKAVVLDVSNDTCEKKIMIIRRKLNQDIHYLNFILMHQKINLPEY